jgi:hypothetical protein
MMGGNMKSPEEPGMTETPEVPAEELKMGKKEFEADPRDFKLSAVLAGVELPQAPRRFGHGYMYRGKWGMLGNDKVGNCVFAGFDHQAMISSKLGRDPEQFTEETAISDYSAVTGYNPSDPSSDQGTYVREGLSYWRKTGIQTADGDRHQIGGFVQIEPKDWEQLMSCAYTFSSVGIGWEVPSTIWDQWNEGVPFDVVDENARIEGGHYTVVTGRTGMTIGGMITWGRRKSFTKDFYERYNDETWAIVFPDEIRKGKNIRGYELATLQEMLNALGR